MYGLRPGALLVFVPKYHLKASSRGRWRGGLVGSQGVRCWGCGGGRGAPLAFVPRNQLEARGVALSFRCFRACGGGRGALRVLVPRSHVEATGAGQLEGRDLPGPRSEPSSPPPLPTRSPSTHPCRAGRAAPGRSPCTQLDLSILSHLQGVLHLTDRAGLCKPPLRGPGDEEADDPFVLAHRRGLAVVAGAPPGRPGRLLPPLAAAAHAAAPVMRVMVCSTARLPLTTRTHLLPTRAPPAEGDDPERPRQLAVVDVAGGGAPLATYRPMQRVWVQLSADGSRAHGPRLRLRLLADTHPEAQAAAAKEAAQAAAEAAGSGPGCGQLSRPPAARGAHRPPGFGAAAGASAANGGRPALQGPPPGFEGSAAAAGAAAGPVKGTATAVAAAASINEPAAAPASSLAGQLAALLEGAGAGDAEGRALGWQAEPGAVPTGSSSSRPNEQQQSAAAGEQAVRHALRRLQAKAARLALRAGASAPGRRRADECGAREAALRQQIAALQQLVPG